MGNREKNERGIVVSNWEAFKERKRRQRLPTGDDAHRGEKRRAPVRSPGFLEQLASVCRELDLPLDEEPREIAHAWGHALEAARAEEKRAAKGPGGEQLDFKGLSLLRRVEQERGPLPILDVLVPELRAVGKRIVVLEDKQSRLDRFAKWFGPSHDLVQTKVIREGIDLLREKRADFLFLDFDVHDPGDHTLREWLDVHPSRKELDGLDLAYYIKKMPVKSRPGTVVVHSRNKVGASMMTDFLVKIDMKPVNWVFDYDWTGVKP